MYFCPYFINIMRIMKMNILSKKFFSVLVFCCLSIGFVAAQEAKTQHTVAQGETLYRISKQYGVTVALLMEYNPGVTAENLQTGAVLLIPSADGAVQPLASVHKVKRGETIWSVSRQYGLTVDELVAANPEMKEAKYKMRKGDEVKIPAPKPKVVTPPAPPAPKGLERVKVAVVLPMKPQHAESARCIEYYRGFLMAADKLKKEGKHVEVYAYDEPEQSASMETLLAEIKKNGIHLVVGPIYSAHAASVAHFTKTEKIKMLAPFSSKLKQVETHPGLYLVNAPDKDKYRYVTHLFTKAFNKKDTRVLVLHTKKKTEKPFTDFLTRSLSEQGYHVGNITADFSADSLLPLLSVSQTTLVVPDASDRISLEQMITKIEDFKKLYPGYRLTLFGYPEWQTYGGTLREALHKFNAHLFTNFYYNTYSPEITAFEKAYQKWFAAPMMTTFPRMALLGYDSGMALMEGLLTHGKDFGAQSATLPMLQSDIQFDKPCASGGYVNRCMWFIHYKADGKSIEKLSLD